MLPRRGEAARHALRAARVNTQALEGHNACRGSWVSGMKKCPTCETENTDEAKFCMSCGSPYPSTQAAPEPAVPPPPPPPPPPRPQPDPLGLVGFAFFLVILGVVFITNSQVFNQLFSWLAGMGKQGVAFRPPDGLISSAALFWALAGVSGFGMAFLRLSLQRLWVRALADVFSGVGEIVFAALLTLYGSQLMTSSEVLAVEVIVVGVLLFVYVAVGLVYGFGKRLPTAGARAPLGRP